MLVIKLKLALTDQRIFIFCNDPSSGHNSLHKLLKTGLVYMHGPFYHNHFIHKEDMSKYFVSKIIYKVINAMLQPWH